MRSNRFRVSSDYARKGDSVLSWRFLALRQTSDGSRISTSSVSEWDLERFPTRIQHLTNCILFQRRSDEACRYPKLSERSHKRRCADRGNVTYIQSLCSERKRSLLEVHMVSHARESIATHRHASIYKPCFYCYMQLWHSLLSRPSRSNCWLAPILSVNLLVERHADWTQPSSQCPFYRSNIGFWLRSLRRSTVICSSYKDEGACLWAFAIVAPLLQNVLWSSFRQLARPARPRRTKSSTSVVRARTI